MGDLVNRGTECLVVAALLLLIAASQDVQSQPTGDLRVDLVKHIQVVEYPKALVMGKSAILCVMIHSTFSTRVFADIQVTYNFGAGHYLENGPEGSGVPIDPGDNFVYLPGGNCTASPDWWLTIPAWFIWTMIGIDSAIEVEIDPYNELDETDEQNNIGEPLAPVEVVRSTPLKILFGDAVFNGEVPFYHEGPSIGYLRDVYPLANDGISWAKFRAASFATDNEKTAADSVALSHVAEAVALGYDRLAIVYHSEDARGRATGILMIPENRVPVVVTDIGVMTSRDLLAHEIGHTYYLWHPHDVGVDVYDSVCYWPWAKDYGRLGSTFMSYTWKLPDGLPVNPRWVDPERYHSYPKTWTSTYPYTSTSSANATWQWNLFDQFTIPTPAVEAAIVVSGEVSRDGNVTLSPTLYRIANATPDLVPSAGAPTIGNYSIRLKDDSGTTLMDLPFEVKFAYVTHDDFDGTTDVVHPDSVPFVFKVELTPETRSIEIVNSSTGLVAASRTSSPVAPTVDIDHPDEAESIELGSEYEISWTVDDPDSADLTYLVAFSSDDGDMWAPIESGLTDTQLTWNTSGLDPGNEYLVKVIASDGFNTGEDTSDVKLAIVDSTPPATTVALDGTIGNNGWYTSKVCVSFAAEDNHLVNRTQYALGPGTWTDWTEPFNLTAEGEHEIRYRSVDESGNFEEEQSVFVAIDWTAPMISISSPASNSVVSADELEVSWTGSDAVSGIDEYLLTVDDGDTVSVGNLTGYTLDGLPDGDHVIAVEAVDRAGNVQEASVIISVHAESSTNWVLIAAVAAVAVVATGLAYVMLSRRTPRE
jgi:hypothetical protein